MRDQTIPHFVGLDVGTHKVRVIIGVLDSAESVIPTIVGYGSALNSGMRKGTVVHIDDVAQAINEALTEAERMAGVQVQSATVNVNGNHVQGMNSKGVIAISSASREISEDDRARVEEAATIIQIPANREIIQVFAKNYRLDGQDNIKDPVGMQGIRLEVDTHIVTASSPVVRNLEQALERARIGIGHRTVSSLAAAEVVLNRKQRESGTAVVDIGAGTTNIVIMEEGEVQLVSVLPVGGTHLTNDLAIGLKTDLDIAEHIKLTHGSLSHEGRTSEMIKVSFNDQYHTFRRSEIDMIIESRLEELFELVDKEFKRISRSRKLPGGVVFVGGTAKIPGLDEFAKKHLELPARIGKFNEQRGMIDDLDQQEFATAAGLMLLDMLLGGQTHHGQGSNLSDTATKLFKSFKFLGRKK